MAGGIQKVGGSEAAEASAGTSQKAALGRTFPRIVGWAARRQQTLERKLWTRGRNGGRQKWREESRHAPTREDVAAGLGTWERGVQEKRLPGRVLIRRGLSRRVGRTRNPSRRSGRPPVFSNVFVPQNPAKRTSGTTADASGRRFELKGNRERSPSTETSRGALGCVGCPRGERDR